MFIHLAKSASGVPGVWSQHRYPRQLAETCCAKHSCCACRRGRLPAVPAPAGLPAAAPVGLGGQPGRTPAPGPRWSCWRGCPCWAGGVRMPPAPRVMAQQVLGVWVVRDRQVGCEAPLSSPPSPHAFASPSPSRKLPFIPTHQFWSIDFFFKVHSPLTLGVNHRHLGLDEGSLSVHNSFCLS